MTLPALTRRRAATCILINLLGTPGLGTLFAKRIISGTAQLIFALLGFLLTTAWILKAVLASVSTEIQGSFSNPPNWWWQWGSIFFCGSWMWSLISCVQIWRQTGGSNLRHSSEPPPLKMSPEQIARAMNSMPHWRQNGEVISRTFQFKDFQAAMKFVNAVAVAAESAWHHPDIDIRWNKVTLALTTHSAGGLTGKDFALAKKTDDLSLR